MLQCVAVYCSVLLQCVAAVKKVFCSVLQRVVVHRSVFQGGAVGYGAVVKRECCTVLQCVAVCSSV